MPKAVDTRKQRANELLARIKRGPFFSSTPGLDGPYSPKLAAEGYKLWMESWIKNELIQLVPELRKAKKENENGA